MSHRTVGVEEEFLLVDPETGSPRPIAAAILASAEAADAPGRTAMGRSTGDKHAGDEPAFEAEMQLQQIETATRPCESLSELAAELRSARLDVARAAQEYGAELVALGTSPVPVNARLFPTKRYRRIADQFGATADEQLSCGCHIHVGIESEEEGVGVLDRIRPWLSVLLALSTNSPFWQGRSTSYASYRTQVWARWPSAGPTELFGTPAAYHEAVQAMIGTDTILDEGMVYFDARLARNYPTVEIRVADVCMHSEDAALLGVLTRALVDTAARDWAADEPVPPVRTEVLKLAGWRASRTGLDAELIDPSTQLPAPAHLVVESFLGHVRDSLEETGDEKDARTLVGELLERGNGAGLQRAAHGRRGELEDIVADAITRTLGG